MAMSFPRETEQYSRETENRLPYPTEQTMKSTRELIVLLSLDGLDIHGPKDQRHQAWPKMVNMPEHEPAYKHRQTPNKMRKQCTAIRLRKWQCNVILTRPGDSYRRDIESGWRKDQAVCMTGDRREAISTD